MKDFDRFTKRIIKGSEENSCWVWCGAIGDDGYGRFWTQDSSTKKARYFRAHRYAAMMALKLSADEISTMLVLHRCDNPLCVRATSGADSHLVLGDHAQNMQDRADRQRHKVEGNKKAHAHKARELRDLILSQGYNQEAVNQFVLGLHPQQQSLF